MSADECSNACGERIAVLERRLSAVIALCDEAMAQPHHLWVDPAEVRAAAIGDTK